VSLVLTASIAPDGLRRVALEGHFTARLFVFRDSSKSRGDGY
jgi:hypothetical protein